MLSAASAVESDPRLKFRGWMPPHLLHHFRPCAQIDRAHRGRIELAHVEKERVSETCAVIGIRQREETQAVL